MTVKELIKKLCDLDDWNATIDVYIGATKGNLITDDWDELKDDDYVLDEWRDIQRIDERVSMLDGSISYHIEFEDWR